MINKSLLFSLLALLVLAVTVETRAQEFGFGNLEGNSFSSLGGKSASRSTQAATGVNTLPAGYLATPTVEATDKELAEYHSNTNLLVLSGLAAMLGVGMGITGVCILRAQPKRKPVPLVHGAVPSLQSRG